VFVRISFESVLILRLRRLSYAFRREVSFVLIRKRRPQISITDLIVVRNILSIISFEHSISLLVRVEAKKPLSFFTISIETLHCLNHHLQALDHLFVDTLAFANKP
jgi:hypothetical protein